MLVTVLGLMIPFAGTTLGAAAVFLMKNKINRKVEKILLGFASGVMLAASVWSLILPAIEMSSNYRLTFLPSAVGLALGVAFFIATDMITDRLNVQLSRVSNSKKTRMLLFAVTLHNIPEGMAVGITLAAAKNISSGVTMAAAITLSVGIALQNIPEGAIISMPLKSEGMSKGRAFALGMLSGAVEPVFGAVTMLITGIILSAMPYFLTSAAGAMIYVVARELVPDSQTGRHSQLAMASLICGFIVMMSLDVFFG